MCGTFAPALNKNCVADGDRLVPQKGTVGGTTAYIHGYLGAFHQAWVAEVGDCSTLPFDPSSGYAYYGSKKIEAPQEEEKPTVTPPPVVDGDWCLQDYQLNYVFQNTIKRFEGLTKIVKNAWTYNPSTGTLVDCGACGSEVGKLDYRKSFDIVVRDVSSGITVAKDNVLSSTKLLLYNTASGLFDTRNVLRAGKRIDTSSGMDYVVDYAFNAVRSLSGDIRTVSTISNQTINKSFAENVLGLVYANKPVNVAAASSYRNSFASVGLLRDCLSFEACFQITQNIGGYPKYNTQVHTCYHDNGTEDPSDDYSGHASYHVLDWQSVLLNAFVVDGAPRVKLINNVNTLVYKYSTSQNSVGINEVTDSRISLNPAKSNGKLKKLQGTYAFSLLRNPNVLLKVFPEVEMLAYEYSGDSINGTGGITTRKVKTMAEEVRNIQSSSLYLYTVKSCSTASADMIGTSYSDTMVTGMSAIGETMPVMAAGGTIHFTGNSVFSINLYGYSLDVINKELDSPSMGSVDFPIAYTDVIADGSNVYSAWNNKTTTSELQKHYEQWVSDVMDIDNYACDLELVVSGPTKKVYNDFSSVLGNFTNYTSKPDGAFPIVIKNGNIDRSYIGYTQLISSISSDYGCDTQEAEELFEKSGLYTAIINAIESSKALVNQSQAVSGLGSSSHWYDEQVKSVVVRRFSTTPIRIKGITCSDKVDFGLAQNKSDTRKNLAQWYFTLYFTDKFNMFEQKGIYEPKFANATRVSAKKCGNILVDKLYVNDADFVIGNTSTADFGW